MWLQHTSPRCLNIKILFHSILPYVPLHPRISARACHQREYKGSVAITPLSMLANECMIWGQLFSDRSMGCHSVRNHWYRILPVPSAAPTHVPYCTDITASLEKHLLYFFASVEIII